MQTEHDPYAALRLADYRRLLSGSFSTNLASSMQSMVIGWEIYNRSDSAYLLGLVGLVQFLPILLLTLPVGHAIDRYSRKGIFLGAILLQIAMSLSLAALSFSEGPIGLMFVCLFFIGVARAFGVPARASLLSQVVPLDLLHNAVTWNSTAWQLATVSGPALGGILLAKSSFGVIYLVAASGSALCAILIFTLKPRVRAKPREVPTLASLLVGARFVWNNKLILATMTLDLFAVLLGGVTMLLPIFAKEVLDLNAVSLGDRTLAPAEALGLLRASPSLGALVMALFMAQRPPSSRAGLALFIAVVGFGITTILFGLSTHFYFSFLMLALTGAFDNISVVVRQTLIQTRTPDDMRGRVSAINTMFISSSNELGEFESGVTAEWFGPVGSAIVGGVGTLIVVVAVMLTWPELLRLGSLQRPETELDEEKT